jgi:hypothetical protein
VAFGDDSLLAVMSGQAELNVIEGVISAPRVSRSPIDSKVWSSQAQLRVGRDRRG